MNLLTRINTIVLFVFLSLFGLEALAKGLDESLIESRLPVQFENLDSRDFWGKRRTGQPPAFEFLLAKGGDLFVRALYPESERFVKYGPALLDRNAPVRIATDIVGLIEYKGLPFAVSLGSDKAEEAKVQHAVQLIPFVRSDRGSEKLNFSRDVTQNALTLGFYGSLAAFGVAFTSVNPFGVLLSGIGFLASGATAYCSWPSNFIGIAQSQVDATCATPKMVNDVNQDFIGNVMPVEKVDATLPWSATNTRVIPRRAKSRLLSTVIDRVMCEKSLMGFSY